MSKVKASFGREIWGLIDLLFDQRLDQQAGLSEPRATKLHHKRSSTPMIVCSCNVLSDHDVRHVVTSADNFPRNAKQIYGCLGCSVECGRCARRLSMPARYNPGYAS